MKQSHVTDEPSLKWNIPKVAVIAERKERKRKIWLTVKWHLQFFMILIVLTSLFYRVFLPHATAPYGKLAWLLVPGVLHTAVITWLLEMLDTEASLGPGGFCGLPWADFVAWRFHDDKTCIGIRRVEARVESYSWQGYAFDPLEIAETDIRLVMSYYMPDREELFSID